MIDMEYQAAFRRARKLAGLPQQQFAGYSLEEYLLLARHLEVRFLEFVVSNQIPWDKNWLAACQTELLERELLEI